MASERTADGYEFCCDVCDEVLEVENKDFTEAWAEAKEQGWRCFKDEDDEWQHRCPECVGKD